MPRYLRYLLIWLSCTAVSVTAVILTVHFVVGSTRPTPPVARSAPTVFSSPSEQAEATRRPPEPSPSATSRPPSSKPAPTPSATRTAAPPEHPRPSKPADPAGDGSEGTGRGCSQGGSGVHTIESAGGQASVRYGDRGVCLVSAIPTRGYTVRTSQRDPDTLSVTFSGERHESVITATTEPEDRATVRETSW